jgi:beta-xylosidase
LGLKLLIPDGMKKLLYLLAAQLFFMALAAQSWNPDLGDGRYGNPIIFADYSDPDIIRQGDDFFLVSSIFTCMPGIPILHSRDLVNWKIVNHVYDRLPLEEYDKPVHGEGSWAPSIRYHEGMYYVYFCTPQDGLFMARTKDPCAGPRGTRWLADRPAGEEYLRSL